MSSKEKSKGRRDAVSRRARARLNEASLFSGRAAKIVGRVRRTESSTTAKSRRKRFPHAPRKKRRAFFFASRGWRFRDDAMAHRRSTSVRTGPVGGSCAGTGEPMPARPAVVTLKPRAALACVRVGVGRGVSRASTETRSYEQTGWARLRERTRRWRRHRGPRDPRGRTCAKGAVATCFSTPAARAPRSTRAIARECVRPCAGADSTERRGALMTDSFVDDVHQQIGRFRDVRMAVDAKTRATFSRAASSGVIRRLRTRNHAHM